MLPPWDGVLDCRWVDLVLSQVGVCSLGDVIVAVPIASVVVCIPGHIAAKAVWLKEACAGVTL